MSPLTKSPEGIQRTNIISYPSLDRYRRAQTRNAAFSRCHHGNQNSTEHHGQKSNGQVAWFIYLCLFANIDMSELSKLGWLSWVWSGPFPKRNYGFVIVVRHMQFLGLLPFQQEGLEIQRPRPFWSLHGLHVHARVFSGYSSYCSTRQDSGAILNFVKIP